MRKILAIGGEPATGKTTLMREFIEALGKDGFKPFSYGLLKGMINRQQKILILGIYEQGETFAGTDRLSMAVMTDAKAFLENERNIFPEDHNQWCLVFEGDRLFNTPFIHACSQNAPTRVFVLKASDEEKKRRHAQRGDKQTESWLKGRATKVYNVARTFQARVLQNENHVEKAENLNRLLSALA